MKKVTSLVALLATVSVAPAHAERNGQHDFDFEIGTWKTHLSRLVHPLSGSKTWVVYDGTTVVRKVWNGRANLVELEVRGPAGQIEAPPLRLYDPEAHQWSLNFANSKTGAISDLTATNDRRIPERARRILRF